MTCIIGSGMAKDKDVEDKAAEDKCDKDGDKCVRTRLHKTDRELSPRLMVLIYSEVTDSPAEAV